MADPKPDIHAIFDAAIERESEEDRARYLDEVCQGDPQIRQRVEALLRAHSGAGNFLGGQSPTIAPTLDVAPIAEKPGMKIGRYKLIHEVGQGGMGVVFMAVQKEPVKREVALKVIKPGMDTREVVARFEAERQALALMDHQCIATVLDGGSTESGRPYFVMELVEGTPITEYADAAQYTTRQRLELFIQVCQAVQHAHRKGVIHRDIKPSNILVTNYDDKAVPKVIDFGIAKAVHQPLTDGSLYTHVSQMMGTPLYMSPEQSQRTGHDVDTRTDVYSLGVLLYELLTGTTPFDKERLESSGLDEFKRIIREEEPPRPSTRLSIVDAALETVADKHRTDLRTLSQELSGELDWIVMKALEKDRTRRYESATDFAKDIQRHLDDEPVEAYPPSTSYRLGKFVRRNKAAITAVAMVLLTLLVGVATTSWQALRATQEKGRAETAAANEELQRKEAERQRDDAREQRERAERQEEIAQENFERARDAVDRYLTKVSEEQLLNNPGLQPLRKDLLELALEYYREFIEERGDDPTLKADLAAAYFRAGKIAAEIGSQEEALKAHLQALSIRSKLSTGNPLDADYRHAQAESYRAVGNVQKTTGNLVEASRSYHKGVELSRRLVDERPGVPDYRRGLASLHIVLGILQGETAKQDEALASFLVAIDIREKLTTENPAVLEYQNGLANAYNSLGILQNAMGERDDAFTSYQAAIDIYKRLAEENPAVAQYQQGLANVYNGVGNLQQVTGKHDEAFNSYRKAIEIRETLADENPTVHGYRAFLANHYYNVGQLQRKTGMHDEANASYQRAIEIRHELAIENPAVIEYQKSLSSSYRALCDNLFRQGKEKEAIAQYREALRLRPDDADTLRNLTSLLQRLGELEKAVVECREAARLHPDDALTRYTLGSLLQKQGKSEEANAQYREALRLQPDECGLRQKVGDALKDQGRLEDAIAEYRTGLTLKPDSAGFHLLLGEALAEHGQFEEAISELKEAVRLLPTFHRCHNRLAWLLANASDRALRQPEQALVHARKAVELNSNPITLSTLGAAAYRNGAWQEAITVLTKSGEQDLEVAGLNSLFLAMAHWQMGKKGEARQWYDKAITWMSFNLNAVGDNVIGLTCIRAEADELGISDMPPEEPKRPQALRFPVVRFDANDEGPPNSGTPAVVVLDNADSSFEKDKPHHDGLRTLTSTGEQLWSHTGFNSVKTLGGDGVAIDRNRGRIYAIENVADRITAFDFQGNKLWQTQKVEGIALMVDPQTGNLWCGGGRETVVFDDSGNEVATYPCKALDMAYDPRTDAFWLVGNQITKVSRSGVVVFREKVDGWYCLSASVNSREGSIWIAESRHPDVSQSKNCLWLRDADGSVRHRIDLGDNRISCVACTPSGEAIFISRKGLDHAVHRASLNGEISEVVSIEATNIAVSPTSGDIWLTTKDAMIRIDDAGRVEAKSPFAVLSTTSWIVAF